MRKYRQNGKQTLQRFDNGGITGMSDIAGIASEYEHLADDDGYINLNKVRDEKLYGPGKTDYELGEDVRQSYANDPDLSPEAKKKVRYSSAKDPEFIKREMRQRAVNDVINDIIHQAEMGNIDLDNLSHIDKIDDMVSDKVGKLKGKTFKTNPNLNFNDVDNELTDKAVRETQRVVNEVIDDFPERKLDAIRSLAFNKKHFANNIKATLPGLAAMAAEHAVGQGIAGDYAKDKLNQIIDATPSGKTGRIIEQYLDQKDYDDLIKTKDRTPAQEKELFEHKMKRGRAFEDGGSVRAAALNNILKRR